MVKWNHDKPEDISPDLIDEMTDKELEQWDDDVNKYNGDIDD